MTPILLIGLQLQCQITIVAICRCPQLYPLAREEFVISLKLQQLQQERRNKNNLTLKSLLEFQKFFLHALKYVGKVQLWRYLLWDMSEC